MKKVIMLIPTTLLASQLLWAGQPDWSGITRLSDDVFAEFQLSKSPGCVVGVVQSSL